MTLLEATLHDFCELGRLDCTEDHTTYLETPDGYTVRRPSCHVWSAEELAAFDDLWEMLSREDQAWVDEVTPAFMGLPYDS